MRVSTRVSEAQSVPDTESASAKKFNTAWRQVINQQRKNDRLRDEVQAFAQEVRNQLEDDEKFNMDITYRVCLHLLAFCNRKSMPHWQRITLIEWVDEYHASMVNNPFSQHLDLITLRQSIQASLAAAYPEEVSPSLFDLPEDGDARTQEEMFADLFDELMSSGTAGYSGAEGERTPEDTFYEEFCEQARRAEQQIEDDSQVFRQLMKASSVNKLFRKLAGILHPDKERDETARVEKNRLMGELIQARDNNDIPKLFALYADHAGGSPLQELGGDLEGVTELLRRHLQQLRGQQEGILGEDPIAGALYQTFYKRSSAARSRAINTHLREVRNHTRTLMALIRDVRSLKKLKPYLELRRDRYHDEEFLDFI